MSLFDIARMLRCNRHQSPVNLVNNQIANERKGSLLSLIGRKFESDSMQIMQYINNRDTLKKYQLDTNIVMTAIFPNTYTYLDPLPIRYLQKTICRI